MKDKQDVLPFFEVESLEEEEFLGLILYFEVKNIGRESKKFHFEFLIFGFEKFLSFFLVLVNFTKDDFLIFDETTVGFLIDFRKIGRILVHELRFLISLKFGSLNVFVLFFLPKLSHQHSGSFDV